MNHIKSFESFINESMYGMLGGEHPYSDSEMRKKVVEPTLGKDYEVFIMFKDKDYQRQLDDIKKAYNVKNDDWKKAGWTEIYRSNSYQGNAWACPEREIIKATILDKGGIVGALYMKPKKVKK